MCVFVCDEITEKQKINLAKTLSEKKRIMELMKTDPDEAMRQLQQMAWERSHRPQGISTTNAVKARKHRKTYCESCGATQNLLAHHINHNQTDNRAVNIRTLCSACHHLEHEKMRRRSIQ